MSEDIHEVYAIRYGHHARRSPENFIGGDPRDVLQPLDFFVWAIVGPSGTIVLDTGFDETMGRKRQREMIKPVRDGLAALGIAADAVKDVIISHLHYDHCGNYDLFPQARYHLQDREMAYATGRCMCHQALRAPFEVDDVVAMVRKVFAGRCAFHDGEDEIVPGVTVHHIGGHSKGLQSATSCRGTIRSCLSAIRRRSPGSRAGWSGSMPSRTKADKPEIPRPARAVQQAWGSMSSID